MTTVSVDLVHRPGDEQRSRRDPRRTIGTLMFAGVIVALLLSKPAPIPVAADPSAVDFGQQTIGRRATRTVTFTNPSKEELAAKGITIEGASADFAVASPCGHLGGGQSCQAEVTFTPRTAGPQTTTISLGGTPTKVVVSGVGVPRGQPVVVHLLSPDAKSVDLTQQSERVVTFTNEGTDDVAIKTAQIAGAGFAVAKENCSGRTLSPRQQCSATVTTGNNAAGWMYLNLNNGATTTSPSPREGKLVILGANEKEEAIVLLTAAPVVLPQPPAQPRLHADVKVIDFTPQKPADEREALQIVTLARSSNCARCTRSFFHVFNDGPGPLAVTGIVLDPASNDFAVAESCSNTKLEVGQSCLVAVFWRPQMPGQDTRLRIESNAATSPDFINVTPFRGGTNVTP